jgi:hypothetical protein
MRVETTKVKADELEQYQNVFCWSPFLLFPGTVEFVYLKRKTGMPVTFKVIKYEAWKLASHTLCGIS